MPRPYWTGSIAQGQSPETYHFDGSYFFDKARGRVSHGYAILQPRVGISLPSAGRSPKR